ncbi:histidine-containing phosphotransfer protein 2 [Camellia lanceoleosa]|uniref:Histidine-containing phosphotransfer protein 2 n=1 Tax=Camellia lanceoleosa TaxID=1840588 RepID=A0ACC0I2B5_9ERIC|nr:histidine-containing phosphotransfer protein 2 [Camellia lanceoleosa]
MLGLSMDRLRDDMNRLLALLFHQGVLDEQFLQLQQLQDESSPNFVSEMLASFRAARARILLSQEQTPRTLPNRTAKSSGNWS